MSPRDRVAHDHLVARADRNPWAAFEAAKKELPKNLTPAQYTAAVAAIAKRLGI
jgi:hypothetical protein